MFYLWIKALHVCAIVVWISGMVLQCSLLPQQHAAGSQVLPLLRRWDRAVTVPAMLLAWMAGVFLATKGGWFGTGWLSLKLVLVVALSAMHGVLAGRLRALLETPAPRSVPSPRLLFPVLFAMLASIVSLVIVKPF